MNHHQFPLTLIVLANLPQTWGVGSDPLSIDGLVCEARYPSAIIGDNPQATVTTPYGLAEEASIQLLTPVNPAAGLDVLTGELLSFFSYEPNWDGEHACAPAVGGIYDAVDFLSSLPQGIPMPKPMVLASGDVALYWDDGTVYAEIGFDGSHAYYAYAERPGSAPAHFDDRPLSSGFPVAVLSILGGGGTAAAREAA
jgi:hypothetical protein